MAGTDKITRVLIMYSRLLEGGKIYKRSFCEDMGINRRTFDRDIEDIRLFLSETFYENELIYDREDESYHLKNYFRYQRLSAMEVTMMLECLRGSPVLQKSEYEGLVLSVLNAGEQHKRKLLEKIVERHLKLYDEKEELKTNLKMQWDLQQCIIEQDMITIFWKDRKISSLAPVSLWIENGQMYLFAYKRDKVRAFCVADIKSFQMEHQKFPISLIEQFSELKRQTTKEKKECTKNEKKEWERNFSVEVERWTGGDDT